METCNICGGDLKIGDKPCYNCQGSGLPIKTDDSGNRFLDFREALPNEFNLMVYYKRTELDENAQRMEISNGEINYYPITDEFRKKTLLEINEGTVRPMEMNVVADSLEEACREAVSICVDMKLIVTKVEERGYSGWGLK